MKTLLSSLLEIIKTWAIRVWPFLVSWLRTEAVKMAVIKILGAAALGGIRAKIIGFIVKHFFDEVKDAVEIGGTWIMAKAEGEIKSDLLNETKESGDDAKHDAISDSI